tara:strand:- start:2563 stop:3849 length:1287 start_codon:yes stop_codon:yes gene_type:complete
MAAGPEIVFVGDDFTGASDTLATLARAGRQARLYLDVPAPAQIVADDALGVATGLRAMAAEEIAAEMARMAPDLAALGARFYHLKVCSTFDSSATVGSIGVSVNQLARTLRPALVAVIGGQPSLGRYCLFGTLFARAADGRTYRIDRHPVMATHPVTPMGEADLRLHLAPQGLDTLELVDLPALRAGSAADLAADIAGRMRSGRTRLLFDAVETGDLVRIGVALRALATDRPILMVGASSVAEALVLSERARPGDPEDGFVVPPLNGPTFVFAGSRSAVTESQIEAAGRYLRIPLPAATVADPVALAAAAAQCTAALRQSTNVLAHLVAAERYGVSSGDLARLSADFVRKVLAGVEVRRLGIAGGDTSSAVCRALDLSSIAFLADLDPGVALCVGRAQAPERDGIRLMLKGGQMGGATLYDRFANSIL